jgi:hypothetical protein
MQADGGTYTHDRLMMTRPDPPPEKTSYATRWSYRQARKAWLRRHGGSLLVPLLIALAVGVFSGSAVAMLLVAGVAFAGAAYQRSR